MKVFKIVLSTLLFCSIVLLQGCSKSMKCIVSGQPGAKLYTTFTKDTEWYEYDKKVRTDLVYLGTE